MVENVIRRTNMKIVSTWTPILRQIDVDLISVCSKNFVYRNIILEKIVCALRLKSNVSINLCF